SATADFSAEAPQARYIEQLWAARRAGALAQEIRLHGANTEVLESLKRLALRYGILTEYTSYLVQEPNVAVNRFAPPPMPQDQAGAPAVSRAREQAQMRDALSLSAITVTGSAAAADSSWNRAAAAGRAIQRVGARVFERRDSVWTDLRHGDSLRVVTVAPFSDAYFALLRALPELVQPAALEPRRARVRAALEELTPRDREVLLLWDAGLPYEEIAAQTGLAPGAVGTTLARARRRLVEAYEAGSEETHVARG